MMSVSTDELKSRLTPQVAFRLAGVAAELEAQLDRFDRPQRNFYPTDGQGSKFGIMPVILKQPQLLGLKVINIFPANAAVNKPTHVGIYQLFSGITGELLATMDATVLTGIRTAAMTAFATKKIAPELTNRIAIIGTGDQAEWHALMLGAIFMPAQISVSGRSRASERALVDKLAPSLNVEIKQTERAVRDATVVCTVTSSTRPVVRMEWLGKRVHINAIGAHSADCAELDEAILEDALCFTDDLSAFECQCCEYLTLARQGRPHPDRIYDLSECPPSKVREQGTTLYKSFGTAIQDIVFAAYAVGMEIDEMWAS
jgi:ornithine cyclodeaminase